MFKISQWHGKVVNSKLQGDLKKKPLILIVLMLFKNYKEKMD